MPETSQHPLVPLLRADPRDWTPGLVHRIDMERGTTMCGISPSGCPGSAFFGAAKLVTCPHCTAARQLGSF
jgi:hypothetical protein